MQAYYYLLSILYSVPNTEYRSRSSPESHIHKQVSSPETGSFINQPELQQSWGLFFLWYNFCPIQTSVIAAQLDMSCVSTSSLLDSVLCIRYWVPGIDTVSRPSAGRP